MRVRPHVPRTGRRRKLRLKKTLKKKIAGTKNPKQLAAARARKRRRK
jgi:hypothetical protein